MNAQSGDELDLQQLGVKAVRYLTKNFRFLLICTLLGTALGFGGYKLLPRVFESQMLLMSDILTESYSERITDSLDKLIGEGNLKELAARLRLTEAEAAMVVNVDIESVKETMEKNQVEETVFIITARVLDRSVVPNLQAGLIEFLRNNEFVKVRVHQREILYGTMVEKIGKEIRSLDSLKVRLFQGKPIYGQGNEMLLIDPTTIYSKIVELNRAQLDMQNALELSHSIQLMESFTAYRKPASPKLSVMLLGGFMIGFLVGVGFLVLEQLFKLSRM